MDEATDVSEGRRSNRQELMFLLMLQLAICVGWSIWAPARFTSDWVGLLYGILGAILVGYVIFVLAYVAARFRHYEKSTRFLKSGAVIYVGAERPNFDRAFVRYALGLAPVTACLQIGAAHLSQSLGLAEVLNRVFG